MKFSSKQLCSLQNFEQDINLMNLPKQTQQLKQESQHQDDKQCYLSSSKTYLLYLKKKIKQFLNKYVENTTDLQVDSILKKLEKVRKQTFKQKGTRQLAAMVVYFQYWDQIRLSAKQFCQRNQLKAKLFNRKYKAYHKLFKQINIKNQVSQDIIKIEQKMQPLDKQEDQDSKIVPQQINLLNIHSPKQAIELVFDFIFKSQYFQANRRIIIDKMASKFTETSRQIFCLINWTKNYTVRMFYAIFGFLKQFGMPVRLTDYKSAVKERTGYHLSKQQCIKTLRLYKLFGVQDTVPIIVSNQQSDISE